MARKTSELRKVILYGILGLLVLGTVGSFASRPDTPPGLEKKLVEGTCVVLDSPRGRGEFCDPLAEIVFDALLTDEDVAQELRSLSVFNDDGSCTVCVWTCWGGTGTVCWRRCRTSSGYDGPGC